MNWSTVRRPQDELQLQLLQNVLLLYDFVKNWSLLTNFGKTISDFTKVHFTIPNFHIPTDRCIHIQYEVSRRNLPIFVANAGF
jgi:hypothetical protein